jgi:hypothetical protein
VTPETEYCGLTTANSSLLHLFFSYLTVGCYTHSSAA